MLLFDFIQTQRNLLLAIAVVGIAVVIGWSFVHSSPLELPNRMPLVCAATGETFNIPRERVNMLPMENPETGERTLIPFETRDGARYVPDRYRTTVQDLKDKNQYVDLGTLAIRNSR